MSRGAGDDAEGAILSRLLFILWVGITPYQRVAGDAKLLEMTPAAVDSGGNGFLRAALPPYLLNYAATCLPPTHACLILFAGAGPTHLEDVIVRRWVLPPVPALCRMVASTLLPRLPACTTVPVDSLVCH